MRNRPLRGFLGTLVIAGGVLLLTNNLADGLPNRDIVVSGVMALLGVVALALFAAARSGWLLPLGSALATIGALQTIYSTGLDSFFTVWGTSLTGLGTPFVGLYLSNEGQWGWLVPGFVLWAVGGALLLLGLPLPPDWLATLALWTRASLCSVIFLGNRRAWWALTPAYVLWALGAGFRLAAGGTLSGEALATWALWAVALLFWLGYLRDDTRRGRLWSAGALSIGGALPLLLSQQAGFWLALGVSGGVGLAWLVAWLRRREPGRAT
jgi:hypothetical protein